MKRMLWMLAVLLLLTACGTPKERPKSAEQSPLPVETQAPFATEKPGDTEPPQPTREPKEERQMQLKIGERTVSVEWEDNPSVDALREMVKKSPLVISMERYGGFEQVGAIGADLVRNDQRITTAPGDLVLYAGDRLVVFFGSNTWAYTRLGTIAQWSEEELGTLLRNEDVTITVFLPPA